METCLRITKEATVFTEQSEPGGESKKKRHGSEGGKQIQQGHASDSGFWPLP